MFREEINQKEITTCIVKNCMKVISIKDAVKIDGKFYCKLCGVAKTKSILNFFAS